MANEAKISFTVNVLGEVQFNRALAGRLANIDDLSPAFERVAAIVLEGERAAFAAQGGYQNNPNWPELSPAYKKWKDAHYPGKGILERTGALRTMMEGGPGMTRRISRHEMELRFGGIRVGSYDLAALHQTGTTRMPARKPLLLSRIQQGEIIRALAKHINQEKQGLGARG